MQTIKVMHTGEGYQVIPCVGQVVVLAKGDSDYHQLCIELEESLKEQVNLGSIEPFTHHNPRAIICYSTPDDKGPGVTLCKTYIYDDDRAWIMNANGKTVATV
jgi:hypothetical protein